MVSHSFAMLLETCNNKCCISHLSGVGDRRRHQCSQFCRGQWDISGCDQWGRRGQKRSTHQSVQNDGSGKAQSGTPLCLLSLFMFCFVLFLLPIDWTEILMLQVTVMLEFLASLHTVSYLVSLTWHSHELTYYIAATSRQRIDVPLKLNEQSWVCSTLNVDHSWNTTISPTWEIKA